jgi:general L-amino acid transport system substrate-binding protein
MVPTAANGTTLADLNGARVCVEKGTTHQGTLTAYFKAKGWSVKPLLVDTAHQAAEALFAGRCRAYTSDSAELAAMRLRAPGGASGLHHPPRADIAAALEPRRLGG